jgi:cholesterol oxidase
MDIDGRRTRGHVDHGASKREPAVMPRPRLSVTIDRLADHYDAVVVGSGYGGAIAAARLAQSGRRVAVLERGRELQPGEFPDTLVKGARQFQWRRGERRHGPRTALYDIHTGHDISVLVGCGLGGTSLINAGVALRPPEWVFDDERWPAALRHDGHQVLAPYYRKAERMLGVRPYPDGADDLAKLGALATVAEAVGGELERVPVAINFGPPFNDETAGEAGADHPFLAFGQQEQPVCTLCGDCVGGCNYGAKNTTAVNYLPLAVRHGAQLFTESEVRTVLPSPLGGWTVEFTSHADGRGRFASSPSLFVRADVVVLAAGVMGSTGILHRSRAEGLAVSPRLGQAFSGNGDVLAFAYGTDRPVNGIGLGPTLPTPETAVGPCITGAVRVAGAAGATGEVDPISGSSRSPHADDLLIQEGAIPGALRHVLPTALALAAETDDTGGPLSFLRRLRRRVKAGAGLLLDPDRGPLQRTLTYLVMSDDRGDGQLVPDGDGLRVRWTGAGDHPVFDRGDDVLEVGTKALGAELVRNPLSTALLHDSLLTVHPLGGCPMGDDATTGVVDDRGRVFTGDGDRTHDGLLVVDGAIVPRPLTVNPLLTISALAERAAEALVDDLGGANGGPGVAGTSGPSSLAGTTGPAGSGASAGSGQGFGAGSSASVGGDGGRPSADELIPASGVLGPVRPGLRFTERMRGYAGPAADGRPETGERRGRNDGTYIEFVLSVGFPDLPALIADPSSPGTVAGTVSAPVLSDRRLRVVDGQLRLVQEDPTHVDTWHMRYSMDLLAEDGRRFHFEGLKVLHDRPGLDAWSDTTTLYVTITQTPTITPDGVGHANGDAGAHGGGPADPIVATGIMTLSAADFAKQMTTMRVTGVASRADRLRWMAKFDTRFLKSLLTVYGGPLDNVGRFPATKRAPVSLVGAGGRRKLRLPAPEPRWCDSAGRWHEGNDLGDDARLRLVRFEGGRRGPVLLASGFGMSATSYLLTTVDTNLPEHLVEKGYDVWLFDYRAGIDLPSSRSSFTMDDIALRDWPAAVAEVLRITGAGSVQALGHCVGSASLMMALAAGMSDVRSAVCMQFTLDPITSWVNQAKVSLGVGRTLARMGIERVAPFRGFGVGRTLLDQALRAVPLASSERCGKATCRWINAIYGNTHRHEQLNDATHDLLDDLFGVGDLTALGHLATIMQRRAVVTAEGADVYRAHPERLRLPILLVQGAHNDIFHPEGSLRTLRWLQGANERSLYERLVLPDYAHLDALIGRNAHVDVFPHISRHLDRFNR